MTKVESVAHLREMVQAGHHDYFIALNFGMRSSKTVDVDEDGKFYIVNEIDDTEDVLTEEDLMDERMTNVGKAIILGAFYSYE